MSTNLPNLDRTKFNQDASRYSVQEGEHFRVSYPRLSPQTNEVVLHEKDLEVTQIVNTGAFSEASRGLLVMRLHFLIHTYLNLLVIERGGATIGKTPLLGHSLTL